MKIKDYKIINTILLTKNINKSKKLRNNKNSILRTYNNNYYNESKGNSILRTNINNYESNILRNN